MDVSLGDTRLRLVRGDITQQPVDAVVNAANPGLLGGGGVDGAIHRAGGPSILEACRALRASRYPEGLPRGEAVATTGGRLPAGHVIHTAGPVWQGGGQGEAETLAACYRSALDVARKQGFRTVAFPSISTGVYGYPVDDAAHVALSTLVDAVEHHPGAFDEIRLVLFSSSDYDTYAATLGALFPT